MNIDTTHIVLDGSVIYILATVVFLVMALIAARIAASTVVGDGITTNRELHKMASEMAKWQVRAAAISLVLSFTSGWGIPEWLSLVLATVIAAILLDWSGR